MLYSIYRTATGLSAPLLRRFTEKRLTQGKEHPDRYQERFAETTRVRPDGKVMWLHGASVGEALSVLPLMNTLKSRLPDWHFILTTGTTTSAEVLATRLPDWAVHQFIPWDHPAWIKKFMDHWRPDAVVWLESELWPNMLNEIARRKIPASLINARMRPKSYRAWTKMQGLARRMLGTFTFILTGARDYVEPFKTLGGRSVHYIGSLKFGARPLPVALDDLARLKEMVAGRRCIGFLSTHAPEEALAGRVYAALKKNHSDMLAINVPRNSYRGKEVAELLRKNGLNVALRSAKEPPGTQTDVYVADTVGEMGLWYSLCPIVVVGGSFIAFGGQNPLEGTHFGCAVLYGPHMFNFLEICAAMEQSGAAMIAQDERDLIEKLHTLLSSPEALERARRASQELANQNLSVIDAYADEIIIQLVDRA